MIACSICQTSNHHLQTICVKCHAFLQTRTENLDLFGTAWKLIERPRSAFRTIAIAEHKNYGLLISAAAGVSLAFAMLWVLKAGEGGQTLFGVISLGVTIGPMAGIVVALLLSTCVKVFARLLGSFASFRNAFAVIAYTFIPLVLALVFIFPIELLTFGNFFFMRNPSPFLLKPASYVILIALNAAFVIWSFLLGLFGIKMLLDSSWSKAIVVLVLSLSVIVALIVVSLAMFIPEVASDGSPLV